MSWQSPGSAPENELVWINDPKLGVTIAQRQGASWRVPGQEGTVAKPTGWSPFIGGTPPKPLRS